MTYLHIAPSIGNVNFQIIAGFCSGVECCEAFTVGGDRLDVGVSHVLWEGE